MAFPRLLNHFAKTPWLGSSGIDELHAETGLHHSIFAHVAQKLKSQYLKNPICSESMPLALRLCMGRAGRGPYQKMVNDHGRLGSAQPQARRRPGGGGSRSRYGPARHWFAPRVTSESPESPPPAGLGRWRRLYMPAG